MSLAAKHSSLKLPEPTIGYHGSYHTVLHRNRREPTKIMVVVVEGTAVAVDGFHLPIWSLLKADYMSTAILILVMTAW